MNEKLLSLIKLVCITYLIIFLPHVISNKKNYSKKENHSINSIDNLIINKRFSWIKKLKLSVISNKKILFSSAIKNYTKLIKNKFKIQNIIIPNKNLEANLKKQMEIKSNLWNIKKDLKPLLLTHNSDAILLDIQDSELTFDKSFRILKKTMNNLYQTDKRLIVLDKPNIFGSVMEGPGKIPLRHGLTIGELARYLNTYYFNKKIKLTVIPMANWNRNHKFHLNKKQKLSFENKVLKIIGKLNPIKHYKSNSCIIFPQKQQLSKWEQNYFKKLCYKIGIYCKNYSKNNKCGIKAMKLIKNINDFSIYNSVLTMTRFLNNRKNLNLQFTNNFNRMLGSTDTKNYLTGKITFKMLQQKIEKNLINFKTRAKKILLYEPHPRMKQVKLIRM